MDLENIENIVLEGGGLLGYSYLSGLRELNDLGLLKKVRRFAGSSVGAMVAGALAVNCPIEKMEKYLRELDASTFKDGYQFFPVQLARLYFKNGLYKGKVMKNWMGNIIKEHTGNENITFSEVYDKYGNYLIVTGSNISQQKLVYFNKDTFPNMPIVDAIRISAGFPLVFQSVLFRGDQYVDGGLLDNYPIHVFDQDKFCMEGFNTKTLGLKLVSHDEVNRISTRAYYLPSFAKALAETVYMHSQNSKVRPEDEKRTISIYTGNVSFLNFDITDEEKQFLYDEGKKAVQNFCTARRASLEETTSIKTIDTTEENNFEDVDLCRSDDNTPALNGEYAFISRQLPDIPTDDDTMSMDENVKLI